MTARRLVAALALAIMFGSLGAAAPQPVRADDAHCAANPDDCVTLTLRLTGYIAGSGFDGGQLLNCQHSAGSQTDSCSWAYQILGTTRVISIHAAPDNPAGAWVCNGTQCGTNAQSKDYTLTKGARGPTVNISFNPIDGHSITISKQGSGTGTVTSSPGSINCGTACSWTFFDGVQVTLTAAPTGGSTFGSWGTGPCSGQGATCNFTTNGPASNTISPAFLAPSTPPPTQPPTTPPTSPPTAPPTAKPTAKPTGAPSAVPTAVATTALTPAPGVTPGPTAAPTVAPSTVILEPSASVGPADTPAVTAAATAAALPGATASSAPDPSPTSGTGEEGLPIFGLLLSFGIAALAVFLVWRRQSAA